MNGGANMKLINPAGRTLSSKEDFRAYRGCVCTGTIPNAPSSQAVYQAGAPSCSSCACSCNSQIMYNAEINRDTAVAYAY